MAVQTNLKSMSIDKLRALKDQIQSTLASKVAEERRTLEAQLGKLSRFASGGLRSKGLRGGKGRTVAAKYRNPDNPSETWAGRGLRPRWLTAAIKAGHKPDDFLIAGKEGAAKAAAPKRRDLKGGGPGRRRASMSGGKVAPKYRNPENPAETWAGRGIKPRCLTAAIKAGKKLEHFSIAAQSEKGPVTRSTKAGKK
jgi:DNA-binding protein H-NS